MDRSAESITAIVEARSDRGYSNFHLLEPIVGSAGREQVPRLTAQVAVAELTPTVAADPEIGATVVTGERPRHACAVTVTLVQLS